MQTTEKLTRILRDLVLLLDEESDRNPAFAERLDSILAALPSRAAKKSRVAKNNVTAPDVFAALREKGETEFRFWLRSLDLPTLKAITKANGFDPARASHGWKQPDKFVTLVSEQTILRSQRGSAFLPSLPEPPHIQEKQN